MGCHTKKVLSYVVKAKRCATCHTASLKNKDPVAHECPVNHEGSSKSMEGEAAVELLSVMARERQTPVRILVGDDDSTFKANIRHSYKAKIDAGLMTMEEWPLTAKGNKITDRGKLDLDVPEVWETPADPSHRRKVVAAPLYKVASGTKKNNPHGLTMVDVERIKTNWGNFQKQYRSCSFDEFHKRSLAVIEHHFNDHTYCGEWCCFSSDLPDDKRKEKSRENTSKYKDKCNNKELYKLVWTLIGKYLTPERLKEIHHMFDSQKNEALNRSNNKFAPKHKTYSMTNSLRSRTAMAVGIDSVGPKDYFLRLFNVIGIKSNDIFERFIERIDNTKKRVYDHQRETTTKRKRSEDSKHKIAEGLKHEIAARKKHVTYQTGMNVDDEAAEEIINNDNDDTANKRQATANNNVKKAAASGAVNSKRTMRCGACGGQGHSKRSSKCPLYNPNNSKRNKKTHPVTEEPAKNGTYFGGYSLGHTT